MPLGQGEVDIRGFVQALKRVSYGGPLIIERGVSDRPARVRDLAHSLVFLRACLAE